ncbi:hypothetical protein CK203_055693 [Vitis vinifera]|uniref:Uncharacterized protein n=1 Tax=Vitis vinifera TaxID=29760 RepID=A0A438FVB3_VITVI|nr:hypothetical protein CK203_055693 [Vitis vinifera]
MVQRRGALLEALFQISKGFFFGPHHLIMAVLLYFEEKSQDPSGPEHPKIPQPERPDEPHPVELPANMRATAPAVPSTGPMPEVAPLLLLAHQGLRQLHKLHSSLLIHLSRMTTIHAHQDQIIATQTQHTAFLRADYAPEETTTGEIEASIPSILTSTAEPSYPQDPPTTSDHLLRGTTSSCNFNCSCHIKDNVQLGWGEES